MSRFRSVLFWLHLAVGVTAGAIIGLLCFTGATLAFEKDIVAWAESDARRIAPPPPNAARISLHELSRHVQEARPESRPTAIVVAKDPLAAVTFALGRDSAIYINPYTGEVRTPASTRAREWLQSAEDWHRVLALGGDRRPIGKAITGVANLAFLLLALTGLYLWWPRTWSRKGVKAVAILNFQLAGKARDFNWHNSIGLWCAPILIVLTLTALPISYRWAGDLVYRLAGETPPAQGQGANPAGNEVAPPTPDARPLSPDAIVQRVQEDMPGWELITLRLAAAPRIGAGQPKTDSRRGLPPVTVVVKEPDSWPRTAVTTLTLDPFTGLAAKREAFADLSPGRRARGWLRFLHTGEAIGTVGQFVAGLACLGGCVLVYTGFALCWRRFVPRKSGSPTP